MYSIVHKPEAVRLFLLHLVEGVRADLTAVSLIDKVCYHSSWSEGKLVVMTFLLKDAFGLVLKDVLSASEY